MQGQATITIGDGGVGGQFLNRQADLGGRRGGRQQRTERDAYRKRQFLRPLFQNLAALIAENAAPDVVEADWNDGHGRPFEDLLEAALEGQHEARLHSAPRRRCKRPRPEQGVAGVPQRLDNGAGAHRGVHRDDAAPLEDETDAAGADEGGPDQEANEARLRRDEEKPVNVADVVADQQERAGRGDWPAR